MFPHSVTIYNKIETADGVTFGCNVVSDVFYYSERIISNEGKGDKYTSAYHVIFSNDALSNYLDRASYLALDDKSKNFTLSENDIIALGEQTAIDDLSDLQGSDIEYFLIRTIADNRYGDSELQNIEVTN